MKLKRLLTGILSAVMALSVCAMPALAADETTKQVTFDPAKESGSLTIVKYEQSEEQKEKKENGDLLGGVTFKAYLLATIKQTEDNGNIKLTYEVQDPFKGIVTDEDLNGKASYIDSTSKMIDSKQLYDALVEKAGMAAAMAKATPYTKTTGTEGTDKGKAVFNQLPLGIYLIEEADAPNQIVTKSASFIVSIPRVDENGAWQYDVTAEPKNVGVYGGVTLTKTGRVAGDTGVGTGITGVEFLLEYKNTKNNDSWEPVDLSHYEVPIGETVKSSTGHVKTGANGVINIKKLTHGEYRFTEISAVNGYIADTNAVYEFQVTESGTVQVKQQGGSYVDATEGIKVVNEKPDLKKEIIKRNGTTSTNNDADYGVGDMVPYTLTVKVPSTIENMKTFYVTDTVGTAQLEHQKTTENPIVVKVGAEELNSDYYTVKIVNGTMTVDFKAGKTKLGKDYADKTITIEYKAKLLDGAVTTKEGNINKAELIYSNKTNTDATEEPETDKNTIHDESVVYTFKTGIYKTGANNAGALKDVKFDLYKALTAEDYTGDTVPTEVTFMGTKHQVVTAEASKAMGFDGTANLIKVTSKETDSQGNITVSGLPAGTYYWVETETLPGYNLLTKPVKADLSVAYEAAWKSVEKYEGNKLIHREYDTTQTTYTDANTVNNKVTNVVNRKGFTLPVTGGFGTLLFSGIGVLLVLAGVCVLFSMKKKNNRT